MSVKIGFVGVGRMGANMARHLKDEGFVVSAVLDAHAETSESVAAELGAVAAKTPAEVTAASDVIITVVTNDEAMRAIFLDGDATLLTDAEGKTFLNCATLSPGIHQEVSDATAKAGGKTLAASMASSISHARNGELYLMVSGDASAFEEQKALLDALSLNLRFVEGGVGKAAEVKALVNMVMNINTAGLAEGLGLAQSLGLDLAMVCEVFSQTGANSRVLETDAEDMIDRDHECWFSAEHAAKDSGIAQELAKEQGLTLPLNEATKAQYQRMVTEGIGELDKSGVAELTFPGRKGHPA
ncbi:MAG: NAD(P)-dependent oxidoreductase [Verrucomicrobiota bacterium]